MSDRLYGNDVAKTALAVARAYQQEKRMNETPGRDYAEELAKVQRETNAKIAGALKFDGGKTPMWQGFFAYFPRAIEAVANVSAYGFSKYQGWGGWRHVENCMNRYADGFARHSNEIAKYGYQAVDRETNLYHLAHRVWNDLALLEKLIEEDGGQQRQFTPYRDPRAKESQADMMERQRLERLAAYGEDRKRIDVV